MKAVTMIKNSNVYQYQKKKNLTFKDKLNEEYKNIDESFEQKYCSRTATSSDRVGHISTASMKRWHKIKDIMKT